MLIQLSGTSVPQSLRGPVLVDRHGIARYWAAVWATMAAEQLADSTHVKKLRYIEPVRLRHFMSCWTQHQARIHFSESRRDGVYFWHSYWGASESFANTI